MEQRRTHRHGWRRARRLGALVAAAVATALVLPAMPAMPALAAEVRAGALPRATADRPDDLAGRQVHLVYAVPADGLDRGLDTNGAIAGSVSLANGWLASASGTGGLRIDTAGGEPDITFFRSTSTDAELAATGAYVRDALEAELTAAGFDEPDTLYAVYYDGSSTWACGGASWPPHLEGHVVALYLRGGSDTFSCDAFDGPDPTGRLGYHEVAFLHEVLHGLGVVPTCGANQWRGGHVGDDPDDLMWAGDGWWLPDGYDRVVLDAGRDDYFDHGIAGCPDLATSGWLIGTAADRPFPDVDGDGAHAPGIRRMAALGITGGYADGTFRPDQPVTRGQMATFLARALGLSLEGPVRFSDTAGGVHERAIAAIATEGVTLGFADGTFRPAQPVTRGQLATFLTRAFDLPPGGAGRFTDVRGAHAPAVAALAGAGIAAGYPDGTFRPDQPVTRGQMATFLGRALDRR